MLDIHPFVVHFAVAILTISVLFDVIAVTTNRPHFQLVGWWNLFVGFFASIFAVITGLYAKNSANFGSGIEPLLSYHQYLGITTAAIFTGLFIWRSVMNRKIRAKWRNLYLTVSVLGVLVVFTTGLIGGQMVYEHGANVEIPQTVSEHQNPAQYAPADSVGPEQ